jgi:hypothetical protein
MESTLRKAYVNLISLSKCSWFNRLRKTNVWAELTPVEQNKNGQKEREKNAYSQTSRLETPGGASATP